LRNGLVAEANGKVDDRKSMNCLTCLLSVICRFAVVCFVLAIVSCGRPGKGSNGAKTESASEYRLDNDRREIKFFHTDDTIGDGGATDSQENEAEEKPGTSLLPPP
jgi:hypothetical protein